MRDVASRDDARIRSMLKGEGIRRATERAVAKSLASEDDVSLRRRDTKFWMNSRGGMLLGDVGMGVKVIHAGR